MPIRHFGIAASCALGSASAYARVPRPALAAPVAAAAPAAAAMNPRRLIARRSGALSPMPLPLAEPRQQTPPAGAQAEATPLLSAVKGTLVRQVAEIAF